MNPSRLFADFARAARRQKLVVFLSILAFAAAATLALKRLPSLYESSATIAVKETNGESDSKRAPVNQSNIADDLRQQATSRALLEAVITKHQLFSDAIQNGASVDDIIAQLRSGLEVRAANSDDATAAFAISYRSTDRETTQQIATAIAEALIAESEKAAPAETTPETEVLRERALQLAAQLNELERKAPWLVTLDEYAPIVPPQTITRAPQNSPQTSRAEQMNIESLRDQQYRIQQHLAEVEGRINAQRQIVEQQKKGSTLRNNPTYAALIARRAELEGQRDTLINRQELTDKHPRVVAILDQINAINRQIEELRQQVSDSVSQTAEARELASLESERNRLKIDLEITDREIARRTSAQSAPPPTRPTPAPQVVSSGRDPRTAQEYIALKKSYDDALAKLESKESKQQATAASINRLQIIEAASVPALPASSNPALLVSIAAAAGLALGAVFAVIIESRRLRSLQTAQDVERYAGVPLLAAIPKTLTEDEQRRATKRAAMRYVFATALAGVFAFGLSQLFIFTEIFSLIAKK